MLAVALVGVRLGLAPGGGPRPAWAQAADGLPTEPGWPIALTDPPPGLHEPLGVAAGPDGQVAVADAGQARIMVFDDDGRVRAVVGRHGEGDARFGHLRDVAIAGAALWVVDDELGKLERFDVDGRFVFGLDTADLGIAAPGGIGGAADGSVWVVDTLGDRVVGLSPSGAIRAAFGASGDGPGELSGPVDVAVAADGSVIVLEGFRWHRFTADGTWRQTRGAPGPNLGQFQHAWSVAALPDGGFVVSDRTLHRLTLVDHRGVAQAHVGGAGVDLGRLLDPRGVAVDAAGRILVADLGNGRVQRLVGGQAGDVFGSAPIDAPHLAYPLAVEALGGDLVVADTGRSRVVRLGVDGRWLGTVAGGGLVPGLLTAPDGLAVGADGSLAVADTLRRRLLRFAGDGRFLSSHEIWGPSARPVRVGLAALAGGEVLVADKKAHALVRYGPDGAALGTLPTDPEQRLGHPSGFATLADGRIVVADWFQDAVHVIGPDGRHAARWPLAGTPLTDRLTAPTDVVAWSDGSVVVADAGRRRLVAFAADGRPLGAWGRPGVAADGFGPSGPSALAVAGRTVVALDRDHHRALTFHVTPVHGWRVTDYGDAWAAGAPSAVRDVTATVGVTLTAPAADARSADGRASSRAEGRLRLAPGAVRVTVNAPGGVRLWHDRRLVVDAWSADGGTWSVVRRTAGGRLDLEWEVAWPIGSADPATLAVDPAAPAAATVFLPRVVQR